MQGMRRLALASLVLAAFGEDLCAVDEQNEYINGTTKMLDPGITYRLNCQLYVIEGGKLEIPAGTTIKAAQFKGLKQAALIISQRARIEARGTELEPVTFTSENAPDPADDFDAVAFQGLWGGVIILGQAEIVADSGLLHIEGLDRNEYSQFGCDNSTIMCDNEDNSGTLQYVRIWHGGAEMAPDEEINGLTLGGVGSLTVVSHIEVAYNSDDGIEFFGGWVNAKYLSIVFVGDDAIDTDLGYQGQMQFVFVAMGSTADKCFEMDSIGDAQPRSFPQVFNALCIGPTYPKPEPDTLVFLHEGTGGVFGNNAFVNVATDAAVRFSKCQPEVSIIQDRALPYTGAPHFLWFSSNNVVAPGTATAIDNQQGCEAKAEHITRISDRTGLVYVPAIFDEDFQYLDPRIAPHNGSSPFLYPLDALPNDEFWEVADFKGAFGHHLWNRQWSVLKPRLPHKHGSLFDYVESRYGRGKYTNSSGEDDALRIYSDLELKIYQQKLREAAEVEQAKMQVKPPTKQPNSLSQALPKAPPKALPKARPRSPPTLHPEALSQNEPSPQLHMLKSPVARHQPSRPKHREALETDAVHFMEL